MTAVVVVVFVVVQVLGFCGFDAYGCRRMYGV